MIARFIKSIDSKRHIYACDTFTGQPYDDKYSTTTTREGELSDTSLSYVEDKLRRFGVTDFITLIQGSFEKTLHSELENKRFTLAFIDCDLYDSTRYVLDFLYSRMTIDGIAILHDYGRQEWGLSKAVNEYCRRNKLAVRLSPIPHIEFRSMER